MAIRNSAELNTDIDSEFIDNTTGLITPAKLRGVIKNLVESLYNKKEDRLTISVDSVAALRALTSIPAGVRSIKLLGYYTVNDGGGGDLYLDPTDTTTTDNGGSVFVTAGGKRIKRTITNLVNVRWFGAKGDDNTNDTEAIQQAIWHAEDNNILEVFFPKGRYFVAPPPFQGTKSALVYTATFPGRRSGDPFIAQGNCFVINKNLRLRGVNRDDSVISSNGQPIRNTAFASNERLSVYRGTVFNVTGSNITVEVANLGFYGNTSRDIGFNTNLYCHVTSDGLNCWDLDGKGFYINGFSNLSVSYCKFDGFKGEEIFNGHIVKCDNTVFSDCNASALSAGDILAVTNCDFINVEGNGYEGIPLESLFSNNRFINCLVGIDHVGYLNTNAANNLRAQCKIINNSFYNCGRTGYPGSSAVVLMKQTTSDIDAPSSVIVSGNTFIDCYNSLITTLGSVNKAKISENYFQQKNATINCFITQTSGVFLNVYILNNVFEIADTTKVVGQISCAIGTFDCVLAHNIFINPKSRNGLGAGFSSFKNEYSTRILVTVPFAGGDAYLINDSYTENNKLVVPSPGADVLVASCASTGGGFFTIAGTGKFNGAEVFVHGLAHPNFGNSPAVLKSDTNISVKSPMIFTGINDCILLRWNSSLTKWLEIEREELSLPESLGDFRVSGKSYERPAISKGHTLVKQNKVASFYDNQLKRQVFWNGIWWDGEPIDTVALGIGYWLESRFFNIAANTALESATGKQRIINGNGGDTPHVQAQVGHQSLVAFAVYAIIENNNCVLEFSSGFINPSSFGSLIGTGAVTIFLVVKANTATLFTLNSAGTNTAASSAHRLQVNQSEINFGASSLAFTSPLYTTTGYSIVAIRIPANATVAQTEVFVNGVPRSPSTITGGANTINIGGSGLLLDGRGTTCLLKTLMFSYTNMSTANMNNFGSYLAELNGLIWTDIV